MASGTTNDLLSIWGSGATDVFAVGSLGTIVHWDGNRWSLLPSGTTQTLWEVAGSGPGDVFIAAANGLLHARARTWEPIAVAPLNGALGVWVAPSRVLVFDIDSRVWRLDRYSVTCVGPERDCSDGWDNDCDGLQDAADPDCAGKVAEQCANLVDDDGDGKIDCADPDCATFPSCRKR
jgi:hypothetical protein